MRTSERGPAGSAPIVGTSATLSPPCFPPCFNAATARCSMAMSRMICTLARPPILAAQTPPHAAVMPRRQENRNAHDEPDVDARRELYHLRQRKGRHRARKNVV